MYGLRTPWGVGPGEARPSGKRLRHKFIILGSAGAVTLESRTTRKCQISTAAAVPYYYQIEPLAWWWSFDPEIRNLI